MRVSCVAACVFLRPLAMRYRYAQSTDVAHILEESQIHSHMIAWSRGLGETQSSFSEPDSLLFPNSTQQYSYYL